MNTAESYDTSFEPTHAENDRLTIAEGGFTAGVIGTMLAAPAGIIEIMNVNDSSTLETISHAGYTASAAGLTIAAISGISMALQRRRSA